MVYDSFLVVAISMAYGATGLALYSLSGDSPSSDYTPSLNGPIFQLGWLATIAIFYSFFWSRSGQTAGMRAWKIHIQRLDGMRPSFIQGLIRYFSSLISLGLFGLGYILCLIRRDGASLHDLISQTTTVYKENQSKK